MKTIDNTIMILVRRESCLYLITLHKPPNAEVEEGKK